MSERSQHTSCHACSDDVEHCHDVLVRHVDGSTECMDPCCRCPDAGHEFDLPCTALEHPCPCVPEEAPEPAFLVAA